MVGLLIFGMLPDVYVSAVREVWQAAIVGPKPGMLNAVKKVGQAAIVHYNTSRHAQALAWQAAMGWAYSPNCLFRSLHGYILRDKGMLKMLWATATLCFHSFFRAGELTVRFR